MNGRTRRLGIGVLGTGWMARAHTAALRGLATIPGVETEVDLVALGARDPERTERTARAWGFRESTTDWREVVDHPNVDIFVNLTGNTAHAAPSIAALELGRHTLCEKPLAVDRGDAEAMAAAAGPEVITACGYNYRFVPALRMVRDLIEEGRLGALRHARLTYQQDWAATDAARTGWRFEDHVEGSAVYDLSHIIDLLRWMLGEPVGLMARISTRGTGEETSRAAVIGQDPEDQYSALVEMESGMTVELHASRIATGTKGAQTLEITGSRGAVRWDMESMNSLDVMLEDSGSTMNGFSRVLVTETEHPFMGLWYAPGHVIGWEQTLLHQWASVFRRLGAVSVDLPTDFATFADGLAAVNVGSAVRDSAERGAWVDLSR